MGKAPTIFAAANAGGLALYAVLYLQILKAIQYEQRDYVEFADGITFLTTAFPVLVIFVAVDLIWVAVMVNQQRKHKDSGTALLFGVVALAAWATAFVVVPRVA
jgi:hypothetical protein